MALTLSEIGYGLLALTGITLGIIFLMKGYFNSNAPKLAMSKSGTGAKVKKHKVIIGNLTAEGFEIKSGLKPGQKIATAGLQTLLDGQEVKLQ